MSCGDQWDGEPAIFMEIFIIWMPVDPGSITCTNNQHTERFDFILLALTVEFKMAFLEAFLSDM